jgi:radical SAM superfamily enzyme YgiQ (UPF0313 family)
MPPPKAFHLILIKPSHYDDDGYVLQWMHASTPSNTLATLYGLALDCAERKVLGEEVSLRLQVLDETINHVDFDRLIPLLHADGGHGLVALCGVQTNQFPRAVDICTRFSAAGIETCIGGFHVSGAMAMLPEAKAELQLQQAMDAGISLFAGEAEGRFDEVLRDAMRREMKPLYNYVAETPSLEGVPQPFLPAASAKRAAGGKATFDAGRGCPFLCSFCTIINVHGRSSRYRSADDVEQIIRRNLAQGTKSFVITDDNFARNRNWEAILDRLIALREGEGLPISFSIQVDTVSHKIKGFIEKCGRAGVNRIFMGLENINPASLKDARKGQNNITEYRACAQAWHRIGAVTNAGYILGFPLDTPQTIARDIEIVKRELPLDVLDFFILTPLPGSQDHKELFERGVALDADLNRYDAFHVTTGHPKMSAEEWLAIYRRAWEIYYTPEHVATVMRRARARGEPIGHVMIKLFVFYACQAVEGVHPLDGGLFRRKYRRDRRPGLPIESAFLFYPRLIVESLRKYSRLAWIFWRFTRIRRRVEKEPYPERYQDIATTPVTPEELETLELYHATPAAETAVIKVQRKREKVARAAQAAGPAQNVRSAA